MNGMANENNVFTFNLCTFEDLADLGCGIRIEHENNGTIAYNLCTNNYYGIYLVSVSNSYITNNRCTNNYISSGIRCYGMVFDYVSYSEITDNILQQNNQNLILSNSHHNNISVNVFTLSRGDSSVVFDTNNQYNTFSRNHCGNNRNYGLLVKSSNDNTITQNNCSKNVLSGISLYLSTNNLLSQNLCAENGQNGILITRSDSNHLNLS